MLFEIAIKSTEISVTAAVSCYGNFFTGCDQLRCALDPIPIEIFLKGHSGNGIEDRTEIRFGHSRAAHDLGKGDLLVEMVFEVFDAVHHKLSVFPCDQLRSVLLKIHAGKQRKKNIDERP